MQARKLASAAVLVAAAHLLASNAASAKPNDPRPATLPADTVKRLESGDPVTVKAALDDVRMAGKGGAPAAATIAAVLAKGLSPALSQAAIDTLGDTESDAAIGALSTYAHHRNVDLRRAAVQALGRMHGADAVKVLRASLSDPDANVRGLAATGLGGLKAKEAVADLFVALDHKVPEAAASLGQLCAGNECERLAGKLEKLPFDVVTSGLDQVLFRPATDVSDDLKVKIVGHVRELGTGEAHHFLKDVQGKWPKTWSTRVKQSIDQAVLATSGSPSSAPNSAGEAQ